ncbi:MAG: ADP-ribosylglycohydrolase family protein [Gemmataceae bacterium]
MYANIDRLAGVLLGTAVGDALGLPREGLSRRRAERLFGPPPLKHRFLFGRGMVSDDTEHACMTAQALLRCAHDANAFARSLAWRLRFWLLGLPAGIGSATLRGILKLWIGFPPTRSGVWSAGNGPAMRSALLGVCLGDDLDRLRAFVRASTRLTHSDPRAERGAFLIALAAHYGSRNDPGTIDAAAFLRLARMVLVDADDRLLQLLACIEDHHERGSTVAEFADNLNLQRGVSGYIYHTVPVALYAWLRWPTPFRRPVEEVIALGGDTDTTGAIAGALAGATCGAAEIPVEWLKGMWEWPRSVAWMRQLAEPLASLPAPWKAPLLFWPALGPRNVLFLVVVLLHAFRRLLPPYY